MHAAVSYTSQKKQLPKGYAAEKAVQSITGSAFDLGRRDLR